MNAQKKTKPVFLVFTVAWIPWVQFLDRPMSQDPHDQLLLQIRGAVAEYERTLISERMRRGRLTRFVLGS